MTIVRGREIVLWIYDGVTPEYAACATNLTMETNSAQIAKTSIDSGREDEYVGGATNCRVDFSGAITLAEVTKWQYADFVDSIGEVLRILVEFVDESGNSLSYDMNALVVSVVARGNYNGVGMFDISLIRTGPMTTITDGAPTGGGIGVMIVGSTFIVQ